MSKNSVSFQAAAAHFDRQSMADHIQKGEQERQEILRRFPLIDWPTMPLEKYALGLPQSSDSYCGWLEFKSLHKGSIRGGTSAKHLIYKRKSKPGWYFPSSMKNENDAWDAIRGDFVKAFQLAQQGLWEQIDSLPNILGANAIKIKTLSIYFPDDIITVCARDHVIHFLKKLDGWKEEMSSWGVVRLNRKLLETLQSRKELQDFSIPEIERFLYQWADPRETLRIFRVTPGEDAKYWQEWLESKVLYLGWDKVGNLREFETKDAFMAAFIEAYGDTFADDKQHLQNKAREIWTLVELEPGDIIVANQGISHVLAVGRVTEPGYVWDPDRQEYKHTVLIDWDTSFDQTIPPQKSWAFTEVSNVAVSFYQQFIAKKTTKHSHTENLVEPIYLELEQALERKGQVILYGPPGTGKTYIARKFAIWWLLKHQGKSSLNAILEDTEKMQAEERRLSTSNTALRVWWFVANPKEWTWDQLFKDKTVQYRYGRLQRNYPLVRPGDLVIGYQSNPDKRIMALARVTKGLEETSAGHPSVELEPLFKIKDGLTYEDLQKDPILGESEPIRNRCQGTLFALTPEEAQYLLSIISETQPEIDKYMTSGEGIGHLTWLTFHPSYSYEDFVEGFRPVETSSGLALKMTDGVLKRVCREAQAYPDKKYLIMIDEINRANVAKVFGELITLLEKDKRKLVITLPQSKEAFTIPPNVYIIGTMNTADRSIKLLDVAFRRRFSFFELMPDSSLLEGTVINGLALDDFLDKLNLKIAQTEGREKQIGHALLMRDGSPIEEPEEFCNCFRQDILPLLQEYCYDDFSILEKYLGGNLVDLERNELKFDCINDDNSLIEALVELVKSQA